jgi:hypothetical protein
MENECFKKTNSTIPLKCTFSSLSWVVWRAWGRGWRACLRLPAAPGSPSHSLRPGPVNLIRFKETITRDHSASSFLWRFWVDQGQEKNRISAWYLMSTRDFLQNILVGVHFNTVSNQSECRWCSPPNWLAWLVQLCKCHSRIFFEEK